MGKKYNVDIKIRYISLLKILNIKINILSWEKKPKTMKFFSNMNKKFRHMS